MIWAMIFIANPLLLAAQGIFSPFTIQGVGEVNSNALINNIGNGGTGIANGQAWHLNTLNPALLPQNTFTTFEMGMGMDVRNISGEAGEQQNVGAELRYLNLGIPLKVNKWTMSVGIRPYSTINYDIRTVDSTSFDDTRITTIFEGDGGLTDLNMAMGYKIKEGIAVGVRSNFLFGPITREATVIADNDVSNQQTLVDRITVSDFQIGGGLSLYKLIYDKDDRLQDSVRADGKPVILRPKYRLNFGMTYDIQSAIGGTQFRASENRTGLDVLVDSDTILLDQPGSILLPSKLGVGVGIERVNIWALEFNASLQDWSSFESFDGPTTTLNNSWSMNFGGEITPDYQSVTSYFSRVTYRLGFQYQQSPYTLTDPLDAARRINVDDFGINFGLSLPMRGLNSLDLAFQYGIRGDSGPGLIEEEYFKIYLGVSLNDSPWKKRPVYN